MGRGGRRDAGSSTTGQLAWEEISKHNTPDDAWVVINNNVYDVSGFNSHPGGRVVFSVAGEDATDVFHAFHMPATSKYLTARKIGAVADAAKEAPVDVEFRELRAQVEADGLMKPSTAYYIWKCLSTFGIGALGFAAVCWLHHSWLAVPVGAVTFGIFWAQCGWLSHDFLHHQVFRARWMNDIVGLIYGNLFQGYSVEWWKNKHNTHHAIPNLHESQLEAHDGDPDVDTLPFLAWSNKYAMQALKQGGLGRTMVPWQVLTAFPLLSFARLVWMQQSLTFATSTGKGEKASGKADGWGSARVTQLRYATAEPLLLVGHWMWFVGLAVLALTPLQAVAFFLLAQMCGGLAIAVPFIVGHNGMPMLDRGAQPGFFAHQAMTTRNVHDSPLISFFMGGLQFQLEHHLFPAAPRHNLPEIARRVKVLAKKHGVPYHATGLWEGLGECMQCLYATARHALEHFPGM